MSAVCGMGQTRSLSWWVLRGWAPQAAGWQVPTPLAALWLPSGGPSGSCSCDPGGHCLGRGGLEAAQGWSSRFPGLETEAQTTHAQAAWLRAV